ncbi:hypothetical protein [Sphaerotilus sp.]|uniref:hypothetical protein n=1 Tax=Sphaerotilus sp. TaxID=2093942 RepID=UPI00286DAC52|nr:hypothetical protein [Sphaerotilus sp.]
MKRTATLPLLLVLLVGAAVAKLPAPGDEAKAKAAEAAAKTAHAGKVDAYKLCLSMDKVAADYRTKAKTAGKEVKPAAETPACADPGAFVYAPPAPASAPSAAASAPPAAASKG